MLPSLSNLFRPWRAALSRLPRPVRSSLSCEPLETRSLLSVGPSLTSPPPDPMPAGQTPPDLSAATGDEKPILSSGPDSGANEVSRRSDHPSRDILMIEADLESIDQEDFIFANRELDRLSMRHGTDEPAVIAGRKDGLVDLRAIRLGDLNGDGVPDLVVANGAGHNILVYPGLGNGRFGPEVNGGKGFAAGTDPVDVFVADLDDGRGTRDSGSPYLVVAD